MARTHRSIPGNWSKFPDFTPKQSKLSYHDRAKKGLVPHEISSSFRAGRIDRQSESPATGKARTFLKRYASKQRRVFHKDIAFHAG